MKIETRFLRNKKLIPLPKLTEIGIVGAGGIGSFIIQGLTIMGWQSIWTWDPDLMKEHNLSSTAYPLDLIGKLKVDAAKYLHELYAEDWQELKAYPCYFDSDTNVLPKMIVCTDDMESRLMIYEKWKKDVKKIHPREKSIVSDAFFIDLRMGATSVEMVTVTPRNDNYMNEWIPTDSVPEAPCSQKHTVFAAQHISSLGLAQVYNIVANLAFYDYIWTSLNPNTVEFGTLIRPKIEGDVNATSTNTSEEGVDRLENNASRSNVLLHRSA